MILIFLRLIDFLCDKQERMKLDSDELMCLIYPVFFTCFYVSSHIIL